MVEGQAVLAPQPGLFLPGQARRLRCLGVQATLLPALLAWSVLCALAFTSMELQLCLTRPSGGAAAFQQALALSWFNFRPTSAAFEWALMVMAMMLPLVAADAEHLRARAFRRDQTRAVLAFLAGFLGMWLLLGIPVIALTLVARAGLHAFGPTLAILLPLLLAAFWILGPNYRRVLTRCHFRPVLPAAGPPLYRAALRYGLSAATRCAAGCLPLMLGMQLAGGGMIGMLLLSLLLIAARRAQRPDTSGAAAVLIAYAILLTLI